MYLDFMCVFFKSSLFMKMVAFSQEKSNSDLRY